MEAIEEIKQRLDIVEVAGQYTRLVKSGKNFKGICPFHQEKHGSFFVFPDKQRWHCFGACSTGGDIFSLVMKKEGLGFNEALRTLASKAGVNLPERSREKELRQKHERLHEASRLARDYYYEVLKSAREAEKARNYVKSRGLNATSLTDFKIGYSLPGKQNLKNHLTERGFTDKELLEAGLIIETESGLIDRFRNRLMFPIHDYRGRPAGFGGREMDGNQPKYLNSPETPIFNKSNIIYGFDLAREEIRKKDQVIMVEGYMDAIIARQFGFYNTVAVMGTSISNKQIDMIKKATTNIILAMDADEAGEKAMLRVIEYENHLENEIKVAIMPPGRDPDEVIQNNPGEWQALVENADPLCDFAFSKSSSEVDLTTAAGKQTLVGKLLPVIAQMNSLVRQAHYLQKLSKMVNVPEAKLESSLREFKTRQEVRSYTSGKNQKISTEKVFASPREEYCLAMLIQNPELIEKARGLEGKYFKNSENAEIFRLIRAGNDIESMRQKLDGAVAEHMEKLATRPISPEGLESKIAECILLLEENHLRSILQNHEHVLSSPELTDNEKEAVLKESMLISQQLKELFSKKRSGIHQMRREKANYDAG